MNAPVRSVGIEQLSCFAYFAIQGGRSKEIKCRTLMRGFVE